MNDTHTPKTICFLVGAPRSGTTWVQRLLQSHPLICGGEESHFFNLFGVPLASAKRMYGPERRRRVGPLCYVSQSEFEDLFRQLWSSLFARLYAENPRCMVHLEKTPFHTLSLNQIVQILPDTRIIFLVRDSLATVASLVRAGRAWGDYWAPDNHRDSAIEWHRHVRSVYKWRSQNADHSFLQVRSEDILSDTRGELARMLRFLLPDAEDIQLNTTLAAFDAESVTANDPDGFARQPGIDGWKTDMPLYGKFVT